jgi:cation transport regulator ChaC
MNYIFGYGSLIEQASRMRTTPAAMYVLPASVKGYIRGWWARTGAVGFSTTFAGAIPDASGSMNGVVYAVSDDELARTNKREAGYTPTDITKSVEILGGSFKPKGKVWGLPQQIQGRG